MLRLKIALGVILFYFSSDMYAQQSYSEWLQQQNKMYMSWRSEQNWHRQYFVWKRNADKEFEQWKKQNDWEDPTQEQDNGLNDPNLSPQPNTLESNSNKAKEEERKRRMEERMRLERDQNPNNPYVRQSRGHRRKPTAEYSTKEDKFSEQNQGTAENIPSKISQPVPLREVKIWAVIVGVARYKDPKVRLNYADDDAYKIYGFLKSPSGGALPEERIRLLIDEDATGNNVRKQLREISQKTGKDDILLFYFSGHGVPNALLVEDFNGTMNSGVLPHKFIREQFENSKAKNVYCIIDACHSGSFSLKTTHKKNVLMKPSNQNPSVQNLESSQPFYAALQKEKKGMVFILSSKGKETSLEASNKRQGVFSYFLIQGLHGKADYNKDKIISVTELFDFTRNKVVDYTKNRQTPVMTGTYSHTMPIALVH